MHRPHRRSAGSPHSMRIRQTPMEPVGSRRQVVFRLCGPHRPLSGGRGQASAVAKTAVLQELSLMARPMKPYSIFERSGRRSA
ncbi:hypothetical protein KL86PLE_30279 [uncultured Pleomorphomonas sp.]|uniref:Uncharacterized protein n=1 Tax=uncultured Pleomorphomonas sp. TaxID=442121 RepID=A0A212LE28_9HYPH|nr:hypothetical protein KL86PLE_30279 [uncultured Pleomorphomonas sp.]